MQRSVCPTITFEEALRMEKEYRKRLEKTHPHLLVALNGDSETQNVVTAIHDVSKRKLALNAAYLRSSLVSFVRLHRGSHKTGIPQKKVKLPQSPSQILQCPKPNAVPSFWCKICKVDYVTGFNFGADIGGKKHKAKKLEILGNRNTGRPASQCAGNRNPGRNVHAVSGSRSNELNVSSITARPICDLSSESRTGGTNQS